MPPRVLVGCASLFLCLATVSRAGSPLTTTCPPAQLVECDGAGNLAARQAWLDAFGTEGGCEPVSENVIVGPGPLAGDIAFGSFCDVSAFTFNGRADAIGHPYVSGINCVLRLTDGLNQGGSAFHASPMPLDAEASFSTYFAFRIVAPQGALDSDGIQGGDGLAFVLQAVGANALGLATGLGYEGMPASIAVEFDTWNDGAPDESDGNHVGIDVGGSLDSLALAPVADALNSGFTWHAWVDHDGAADLLEVRLAPVALRPEAAALAIVIDLPSQFGSSDVFAGFSAGTRNGGGAHEILQWAFNVGYQPFGCGATASEEARLQASDECGSFLSCTSTFTIIDTTPPQIDVGPVAGCHESLEDAVAAVLAAAVASDDCSDEARLDAFGELLSGCSARVVLRATDGCGNVSEQEVVTTVVGAGGPEILPGAGVIACSFPPNHAFACFGRDAFSPEVVDPCGGGATWRFAACVSDQPEDGRGDGNTEGDCIVVSDDEVCFRAERQGGRRAGRTYEVFGVAEDACGNVSAPAFIGSLVVPHDASLRGDCVKAGR